MIDRELIIKENSFIEVNPQALISQAIEKNLNIEAMERLLSMRRELKAEQAKEAYFQALAIFQTKCPLIKKNKIVYEKNSKKIRYRYASLDSIISQIRNILQECGFSYAIKVKQSKGYVTSICESYHSLGHRESTEFSIPIDDNAYMSLPQKVASALTFSKRYAFCNAYGIMNADEDNESLLSRSSEKERLPDENDALYKACIILFNHRERGIDIFTNQEKFQYKKSLDAISKNLIRLKEFYQTVNKLSQDRIRKIKGGNENAN